MYAGHSMSVTRMFSQRRQSSRAARRTSWADRLATSTWRSRGRQRTVFRSFLKARDTGPEGQSGVAAGQGRGKGRVAPAEKMLEVQGATFFAGEPGEVAIGRLGLRAHAAKPGRVQVEGTGHVYTLS